MITMRCDGMKRESERAAAAGGVCRYVRNLFLLFLGQSCKLRIVVM